MSFNPDWCRQESLRCEECPIRDLERIDEGVTEHTIDVVKQYGIGDVVQSMTAKITTMLGTRLSYL